MSVLSVMIAKEETRNKKMVAEYKRELEALPKGSVKPKKINGGVYYYLVYRSGDKVVNKYIGKGEESVAIIRERLARRKQVEEILKKLTEEMTKIKKMEAVL